MYKHFFLPVTQFTTVYYPTSFEPEIEGGGQVILNQTTTLANQLKSLIGNVHSIQIVAGASCHNTVDLAV